MNNIGKIAFTFLLMLICLATAHAQNNSGKKNAKRLFPDVYLDHSSFRTGPIQKNVFDSLIKLPLTSRDSSGNQYRIVGFDFTYADVGLFEDSEANLSFSADYRYEYCPGDTVSESISSNILNLTKAGDTVIIDHVRLTGIEGSKRAELDTIVFYGKTIKLYITK